MHRLDFIGLIAVVLLAVSQESDSLRGTPASPVALVDKTTAATAATAGSLRDGVLTVDLIARQGYLAGHDERGVETVVAFGEVGETPQIPGPTLRVRSGTVLRVTLRNATAGTLVVDGLADGGVGDRMWIPARARRSVSFRAVTTGSFTYRGTPVGDDETIADASGLSGLLVVLPRSDP